MQLNLIAIILFDLLPTQISVFSTGGNVHVQLQQNPQGQTSGSNWLEAFGSVVTENSSWIIMVMDACVAVTVKPGRETCSHSFPCCFLIYRF